MDEEIIMGEIDIYVAIDCAKRKESIGLFTEKYLVEFAEVKEYYEYPVFRGENEFETEHYWEMISFVMEKEGREFRFYFKNTANKETPFGMMFFNKDGSLFLGVQVYPEFLSKYENRLKNDFNTSLIMVCYNTLPSDNLADFKSIVQEHS